MKGLSVARVYVAEYKESCGVSYFVMFVNSRGYEMSPYRTPTKSNANSEARSWAEFFEVPCEEAK